jgi:hypothetical protein
MDLRQALKEQYHAGLAMLADCVERCPDEVWVSGTYPRTYWRIAWHTVFFTHLYLGQNEDAYRPWTSHGKVWENLIEVEPYELPPNVETRERKEMLEYIAFVDGLIDPTVDALNLDATETGFSWYKNMTKLSHQLMNLRHIQGHVGQLSEILMAHGVDTDWVAKAASHRV